MVKQTTLLSAVICLLIGCSMEVDDSQINSSDENDELKVGLVNTAFPNLDYSNPGNQSLIKLASRALQIIAKKNTGGLRIDVSLAKDASQLANGLKKGDYDVGIFHGFELGKVMLSDEDPNDDLQPILIPVRTDINSTAVLIGRPNLPIQKCADIGDGKLGLVRNRSYHLEVYAQKICGKHLAQKVGVEEKNGKSHMRVVSQPATAIGGLKASKYDAVVLDMQQYRDYIARRDATEDQFEIYLKPLEMPASCMAISKSGIKKSGKGKLIERFVSGMKNPKPEDELDSRNKTLMKRNRLKRLDLPHGTYVKEIKSFANKYRKFF